MIFVQKNRIIFSFFLFFQMGFAFLSLIWYNLKETECTIPMHLLRGSDLCHVGIEKG